MCFLDAWACKDDQYVFHGGKGMDGVQWGGIERSRKSGVGE